MQMFWNFEDVHAKSPHVGNVMLQWNIASLIPIEVMPYALPRWYNLGANANVVLKLKDERHHFTSLQWGWWNRT